MNKFDTWYYSLLEDIETQDIQVKDSNTAKNETNTDNVTVDRNIIINDVDTILKSLETLSSELKEDLDNATLEESGEGFKKFMQFTIHGPKAAKAQKKVNKIKLNLVDLQFARDNAPADKKEALKAKYDAASKQASELQQMVHDRFDEKGDIVKRMIKKAKIEGQLAVIKRTTGMEDDPKKKAELADKMKEIADAGKKETAALKELSKDDDVQAAKKKAEADKAEADKAEADKAEADKAEADKAEADKAEADKAEADKAEADKAEDKKEETEDKAEDKKEETEDKAEDKKEEKNESKSYLLDRAERLKAFDLYNEIELKENWQLVKGTKLRSIYEYKLNLLENNLKLNENRYSTLSIKDKFSKLI